MYLPPSKRARVSRCVNCQIPTDNNLCELCHELTECIKCHKRLHIDLFSLDTQICITCTNRSKEFKKYAIDGVFSTTLIPSDESCVDLEAFVVASRDTILQAVTDAIHEQRLLKLLLLKFYQIKKMNLLYVKCLYVCSTCLTVNIMD